MTSPPSIWRSPRAPAPSWRPPVPRIVAESLRDVGEPLRTVLVAGPPAPPAEVARAIAQALTPAEAPVAPPAWLRPEQRPVLPRVCAALDRFGGVLLADPVGSGKTWIALASVAAVGVPAVAIVPAALREQWWETARRAGVPLAIHSHEALSRGRLPEPEARLAIVDECHRFRHPGTRRYPALARWLVGRCALLLSATPVVNRLDDLAHQLLLAVRDDALAARGLPSLLAHLARGEVHPALGELVLCRPRPAATPPARTRDVTVSFTLAEQRLQEGLARLRLSRDPGIAGLLRVLLLRAFASSPAALAGALERYLALLAQARSARDGGRRAGRAALRAWCGADLGQYTLWALCPDEGAPMELSLSDHAQASRLHARARLLCHSGDGRLARLEAILADGRRTLVFTTSRDTLQYLRRQLAPFRPAWVTGDVAGIGLAHLPRRQVLRWFGMAPPALDPPLAAPSLLLATDVAAEGLDLQRAERVVHYDLPWTSIRVDQREGRARRLGGPPDGVEVVRMLPPPALEAELAQLERLTKKRRLAGLAGLDDDARWLHRWRAELADWVGRGPARGGLATVAGVPEGWLVGLLYTEAVADGSSRPCFGELAWIGVDHRVTLDPSVTVPRLLEAAVSPAHANEADAEPPWPVIDGLVRERLRAATGGGLARVLGREQRRVCRSLRALASQAARRRDASLLAACDRALLRVSAGLTAGELLMVSDAAAHPGRILAALAPLLAAGWRPAPPACLVPRLVGIVRVASFPPCDRSAPSCSTSTGP